MSLIPFFDQRRIRRGGVSLLYESNLTCSNDVLFEENHALELGRGSRPQNQTEFANAHSNAAYTFVAAGGGH